MNGLNKVIIMGNLGADPELRLAAGGTAILKLNVATNESWPDKNDPSKWQERTEWHRVTVFGKRAETLAKFLRKGMFVTVDGSNRTSSYDKEGQKHYRTEIVAHQVWSPGAVRSTDAAGPKEDTSSFAPPSATNGGYGRAPAAAAVEIPF
jgi:single-strand DNA-binding protein